MATDNDFSEFEIERLRAEIFQEEQMRQMLEKSSNELRQTVDQLEKRIDSINVEGNEWKTRFETQEEINMQFRKQILILQQKIENTRNNISKLKEPSNLDSSDDLIESKPFVVQKLKKEQGVLESQIKDLDWRLEQESKAYHKANDERKQYMAEINTANFALDSLLKKAAQEVPNSTLTQNFRNIPEDQRVLDPKRGPIKKTAAVKNLPKIDQGHETTRW